MDFSIPTDLIEDRNRFREFLKQKLSPNLPGWQKHGDIPRDFYSEMGNGRWFGFEVKADRIHRMSSLRGALVGEEMASLSPGVCVAALAHAELGLMGLWLFGSDQLKRRYGKAAVNGETLMCLGNSENTAGSDVANIQMQARKTEGGWVLNGTKSYVTNGLISDLAVITAVSDPEASRNNRISMFLVDLHANGVTRKKLNKQVWIPSDLTRVRLNDVFVPDDHVMGEKGRGLQQVLTIFSFSRVPIAALTLGTATGALELAIERAKKRTIMGKRILDFQAKAFEIADCYARIEAARLMLWRACWAVDSGKNFRMESSLAKYLAVNLAREIALWAADLFGAVSVVFDHPIHKFPMDAWASSLGEGTQDIQKLVIFRELMKKHRIPSEL